MNYQKRKEKTIRLRKKGLSYSEILEKVPVAKSTLSLWLRSVDLSQRQEQRITEKKMVAQKRGAEARRNIRIQQTKEIFDYTKKDIKKILSNPLWLSGIMLYWAEGSKQKENSISSSMRFSNMDRRMINFFLYWSVNYLNVKKSDFTYDLYIHEDANIKNSLSYWTKNIGCEASNIRVYLKRNKLRTTRKNTGINYHGVIRVNIRKSSALNRKVDSWIAHLCEYWGIV